MLLRRLNQAQKNYLSFMRVKQLAKDKKISKKQLERFNELKNLKKKLNKAESQKVRRTAIIFIKNVGENIQRRKSNQIENSSFVVNYGNKTSRLYLFEDAMFVVEEDKENKTVQKIEIKKKEFVDAKKLDIKEFYDYLSEAKSPKIGEITEKHLKELEKLLGSKISIRVAELNRNT